VCPSRNRVSGPSDSQDLEQPWERKAVEEEKQKCLRAFLCDYTAGEVQTFLELACV
jgi:hypothetical protein